MPLPRMLKKLPRKLRKSLKSVPLALASYNNGKTPMSKENHHKRRDVIAEEAASYLVELESPQADTKAKLAAWLKTSPEHVEEFLAVAELWGALPDVAKQPSIEELVALAAGEDNVIDLAYLAEAGDHSAPATSSVSNTRGSRKNPRSSRSCGRLPWERRPAAMRSQSRQDGAPTGVFETASSKKGTPHSCAGASPFFTSEPTATPEHPSSTVAHGYSGCRGQFDPHSSPVPTRRRLRTWSLRFAAAATIATITIIGALQFLPPPIDPNVHTTAIGEQTSLPLPDGSMVTINTQSTLKIAYSNQFRDIHLVSGEALFDVTKDPERPFRVMTEHAVVTAVGTQFNVRNVADDVVVTVVEGIVDVEATHRASMGPGQVGAAPAVNELAGRQPEGRQPARLTVGQQARIAAGEVAVIETAVDKATAWRERRLVFESLTLAEVIDEFNRYNDPPLLIDDPALRELPISGVFRANDRDSFVAFLKTMDLAQSRTLIDGTIVLHGIERPLD